MTPGAAAGAARAVLLAACWAAAWAASLPAGLVEAQGLDLTVVHVNDMHARYEQTNQHSGACSSKEADAGACYGGHARVATVIKQAREQDTNVLVLNAGDTFQGTVYYSLFKWNISADFVNRLHFDAITLGNHEFDDHVVGLVPFAERINKNLVLANADFSKEPTLAALNIKKSIIIERGGFKIGVIGYLTPDTVFLASTDNVSFGDEVTALTAEAAALKQQGVHIIIGLGHSGYERDQQIAAQVPHLDLVVGGHSHSFLYSGTAPDSEIPIGLYPTWVKQPSGRRVPVVQAYAFTKYAGKLKLQFDADGELKDLKGGPILLDKNVPEDPDTLAEVMRWKAELDSRVLQPLGKTAVFLDGGSCRRQECNLGNLVADAFVFGRAEFLRVKDAWTDAAIALVNSGSIRTSINASASQGVITVKDAMEIVPFDNLQVMLKLRGSVLVEALEHGVSEYVPGSAWKGSFLQVSGLRVTYDVHKPAGQRVASVAVRCADCTVPSFGPLDHDKVYGVIVNGFLANGGDGFSMLATNEGSLILQDTDSGVVQHYLTRRGLVYPALEGRIAFEEGGDSSPTQAPATTTSTPSPAPPTSTPTPTPTPTSTAPPATTPKSSSARPRVPSWPSLLALLAAGALLAGR